MYRITVRSSFSAAHRLLLAEGRYERPHGHDWSVEVRFVGSELDRTGVLVDFEEAQAAVQKVLAQLHDTNLNEAPLLSGLNPSAENVARVIFEALSGVVTRPDLLESVSVEEAPGCSATYFSRPAEPLSRACRPVDDKRDDR
jgi:6-pyruvoyltetrahydropterin/6-carboxytetrahydropterin synthase